MVVGKEKKGFRTWGTPRMATGFGVGWGGFCGSDGDEKEVVLRTWWQNGHKVMT